MIRPLPPSPTFERTPCSRCGSANTADAATRCRPSRDESGESTCPATLEDAAGYFLQETPASLAALDAWIEADRRLDEARGQ